NHGNLRVADDVTEEMLSRKIARIENHGNVRAPDRLLAILLTRCPENLGKFSPTGLPQDDSDDE
ncbi:MAG: hypothetical protein MUQ65_02965, partial [Armatimonadetes bacterium]|nr:hypothetical protein [Armatimonadota bacterium]